jgi:hypothetical protein
MIFMGNFLRASWPEFVGAQAVSQTGILPCFFRSRRQADSCGHVNAPRRYDTKVSGKIRTIQSHPPRERWKQTSSCFFRFTNAGQRHFRSEMTNPMDDIKKLEDEFYGIHVVSREINLGKQVLCGTIFRKDTNEPVSRAQTRLLNSQY